MRRKALLQFANKLAHSRRPFNLRSSEQCITAYAAYVDSPRDPVEWGSTAAYAVSRFAEKFKVPFETARRINIGDGLTWDEMAFVTRKMAAAMLRRLARTGKVEYDKPKIPESGRIRAF